MGEPERQIDEETGLEIIEEPGDEEIRDQEAPTPDTGDAEQQEAYARRMGWVPKDEYRGDPSKWISAEEFIEKGENELPVLRERLRKQDSKLKEIDQALQDMVRKQGERDRRMYERARQELEAKQRAAVEEADTETYDQVTKQIKDLEKATPKEQAPEQTNDPVWADWTEKNPWYGTNKAMTKFANSVSTFIKEQGEFAPGTADFLNAVRAEVAQRFPDKFQTGRRSGSGVERSNGPRGRRAQTYDSMPAEARQACDDFVKKGWMTKEQYVKSYYEEENQ